MKSLVVHADTVNCFKSRLDTSGLIKIWYITSKPKWGSGIKTHSLGGACIGDTGSELQLYVVVYCTHIELD